MSRAVARPPWLAALAVVVTSALLIGAAVPVAAFVPRDDSRVIARVEVPGGATTLAMGPKGRFLWTLSIKGTRLTPLQVSDNEAGAGIPLGGGLRGGIALAPDGRTAYVSSFSTRTVLVVDLGSGRVIDRIRVGRRPDGLSVSPDGRQVYVACWGDQSVFVISTASNRVLDEIPVRGRPDELAFAPDGRRVYVASLSGDFVSVIDTRSRREIGDFASPGPTSLAVSPDGTRLYVAGVAPRNRLTAVDTASLTEVGSLRLTDRPKELAISPDGARLYLAMQGVGVVDTSSLAYVGTIQLDGNPTYHVAVRADGARVYATSDGRDLFVVDVAGYSGQ
jgi:YVTN family beta-propeller protein